MEVTMRFFVLFVAFLDVVNVHGVYFTMTNLQLNLPGDPSKHPPGDHILVGLRALPSRKGRKSHLRYSLPQHKDGHFRISPTTGELTLAKSAFKEHDGGLSTLTTNISVADSSKEQDDTVFSLNLSHQEDLDCDLVVTDLCYWQSVTYKILENRDASIIGTLSSPYLLEICQGFRLNYTIINKENRVELIPPSGPNKLWSLKTRGHLERDVNKKYAKTFPQEFGATGEVIRLGVKCTVVDPQGTRRDLEKNLTVRVLDENDNLPQPQDDEDVHIVLENYSVNKDQPVELKHKGKIDKTLIFIDKDSRAVNDYRVDILNDTLGMFKPNCTFFDEDMHDELQTAIYCKLIFTRRMEVPKTPYTVVLQINDTSHVSKSNRTTVRIPIHLHAPDATNRPNALGLTEPPTNFEKPLILYPDRTVVLFRSAGPLARVTQPKEFIKDNRTFVLLNDTTHNGAFEVTHTEGIVYVHDIGLLRTSRSYVKLKVQWSDQGKIEYDDLIVHVIEEPGDTCNHMGSNLNTWPHCADFGNPKKCTSACALATGGGAGVRNHNQGGPRRCIWRGDPKPNNIPTKLYATCTPDNVTCPDGICDAHEQLHIKICPQDCSDQVSIPAVKNKETGRGIVVAPGVCTCSGSGTCTCNPREMGGTGKKFRKSQQESTNQTSIGNLTAIESTPAPSLSRHTVYSEPEMAKCGKGCLFGILAGGLFLILAVAAAVACWRFDKVHKVRGKFSGDSNDLSAPLSDYVDRGIVPENTITLNFDMTTSLSQQQGHKIAPDPKWEFPRNQLVIEQTLGEGEFGRVLRARARDIGGQSGYTIVAVKTLKEDAREAELADLLSEYELLKGVSHPNIIRLLGASTLPGGPVYLIIEFAHYGSLRSYLRRSRHLKSESRLPFSSSLDENSAPTNDNYDEPKQCKVSGTDILSFAWQISNGMSHLSEIKLVHRDLAARNVLLTEDKVCKISDFGLTRDIYEDDAYFKRSKGRVPVKWMAPESLSDHVYTSKSDVWSFGILVWELVTLGATPYPGIQVQNLFHLLKTGYRMERPDNCSPALYKIMRSCWNIDPDHRPPFQALTAKWEQMLGDQVEYLDLTPNAIHNRSYFCTLDDNEEDDNEINENADNEEILEDNFVSNRDYPKCGDTDKLLEEPKLDNLQTGSEPDRSKLGNLQMSPLAQGYETPVKRRQDRVATPSNEDPQYYTDMEASKK